MRNQDLKNNILDYLNSFCLGKPQAVKADTLARTFRTSRREVNSVIRELRIDGQLIGSSKEPPHGYFIPITREEAKEYLKAFRNELFDMLRTYNRQRRAQKDLLSDVDNHCLFQEVPSASGQLEFVLSER